MSLAEEMLNTLNEGVSEHSHSVSDTDSYFTINPDTREIESTSRYRNVLMQYDHNSERYTFSLTRYIDGHDMSLCNSVVVSYDNIEEQTETTNSSFYDVDDLRIDPANSEMVIASWLVSRAATQLAGKLSFSIEFKCVDSDGNVTYEWATNTFNDITIHPRKKNTDVEVTEHVDLLEQWRTKIFGAGDSVMVNIATEGETQVAAVKMESQTQQEAVELKGANTLTTIPEDYTEVNNKADEAVRTKADAIVCEAEGEVISLTDSSDDYIRGIKLFGKSTQAKTTGKNLFDMSFDNMRLVTETADPHYGYVIELQPGTYTISATNYIDTYLYAAIYDGSAMSDNYYVVLPTETRSPTITINNGDLLYLYNASDYDSTIGNETATKTAFSACPIQIEVGPVATEYEPYTGGKPAPNPEYPQEIVSIDNPTVNIYGKNLIKLKGIDVGANVSFNVSDDGYTITMVGGSKYPYTSSYRMLDVDQFRGKTVIFKQDGQSNLIPEARGCAQLAIKTPDGSTYLALSDEVPYREITIPEDVISITLGLYTNNTSNILESDNRVIIRGLMLSFENGDWEPYIEPQPIQLQHALPGIPVTSGGNYTDENGQQWVCNEIDLDRGVYVQRVAEYTVHDSPAFNETADQPGRFSWNCLPEHFATGREVCYCNFAFWRAWGISDYAGIRDYGGVSVTQLYYSPATTMTVEEVNDKFSRMMADGNPPFVIAKLATPIETPLTAEEITAFKALRTNYPNTTILNDAGAWMSVKYNADTKSYVENPKTLKLVDSSTGVVYELKIVDGNITVVPV